MRLKIGDSESIKLRDEGRKKFEEQEREGVYKYLKERVECPDCPYEDPACEGPKVEYMSEDDTKIVWSCSQAVCPCCDTDMDVDEFETDLEGKVLYERRN